MKVLTAAQMRAADRRTIELGIPGLILMENAGLRVVEFLLERFAPLSDHHVAVVCGKGNNGGDGLVVARQLHTRALAGRLDVVLAADPASLQGDAAANYRMLLACGCPVAREFEHEMTQASIVVDALLGTGLNGPAAGEMVDWIERINLEFAGAAVVAVDIPSGLPSDSASPIGDYVHASHTVTFTAPKIAHALPPNCEACGDLLVASIGTPEELCEQDPELYLSLAEPKWFEHLFWPRDSAAHKGDFGHVLVAGGSRGKTGAAAMAGLAALRAGAGLVTVASAESAVPVIAAQAAELMTEALPETESGAISLRAFDYDRLARMIERMTILALGPGIGTHPDTVALARRLYAQAALPVVVDADGLNALAGMEDWSAAGPRILTPHPGEMARLAGLSSAQVQADRTGVAREFAVARKVTLVLKGQRTVMAFADGRVWINPTGTPAMATGGSGDILTGLIAGLAAQFPEQQEEAVAAAVWLHGRAGELGAAELGEKCLLATDLLDYLPEAMEECADV
ncbi:MAG: NAD(P)H-hydrate dehydratase [Acidobacteria bacterium]|nr:NAD(P)H-hydrate dehydratase [Acidobacteriota bacterium]